MIPSSLFTSQALYRTLRTRGGGTLDSSLICWKLPDAGSHGTMVIPTARREAASKYRNCPIARSDFPSQNHFCPLKFPRKRALEDLLTLRVDSERWCESVISPPASLDWSACCADVATSLCEACGQALCETHEVLCPTCFGVTCPNCDHVCRLAPHSALIKAA